MAKVGTWLRISARLICFIIYCNLLFDVFLQLT